MRRNGWILLVSCLALCLTACTARGPVISKSKSGNLQITVRVPDDVDETQSEVYIDGLFIGNVSIHMPVIHVRRGLREIRVEAPDCQPFEKQISILGDPNHQVLNVKLKK